MSERYELTNVLTGELIKCNSEVTHAKSIGWTAGRMNGYIRHHCLAVTRSQ